MVRLSHQRPLSVLSQGSGTGPDAQGVLPRRLLSERMRA